MKQQLLHFFARLFCRRTISQLTVGMLLVQTPASAAIFLPVQATRITSNFGMRVHPVTGKEAFHAGVDLAAGLNDPVSAILPGNVVSAGYQGALGNAVRIDHKAQGISSIYGHLNKVKVRVGQKVTRGQLIGLAGSTGRSTGTHLHLTVKSLSTGRTLDPIAYLKNGRYVAPVIASRPAKQSRLARSKKAAQTQIASATKLKQLIAAEKTNLDATATKLAAAETKLSAAKELADKFQHLYEEGAISRKEAEAKLALAQAAEKEVESIKSELTVHKTALASSETALATL